MKKYNVRVLYYNNEVASDKQTAIEMRARVMPDMKNWNFSASAAEDVDDSQ